MSTSPSVATLAGGMHGADVKVPLPPAVVDGLGLGVDQIDLEEEADERAFGEKAGAGLEAPFQPQPQQQQHGKPDEPAGGLASELEAL